MPESKKPENQDLAYWKKLAEDRGLVLATLCDMVLIGTADRSNDALIKAVGTLKRLPGNTPDWVIMLHDPAAAPEDAVTTFVHWAELSTRPILYDALTRTIRDEIASWQRKTLAPAGHNKDLPERFRDDVVDWLVKRVKSHRLAAHTPETSQLVPVEKKARRTKPKPLR